MEAWLSVGFSLTTSPSKHDAVRAGYRRNKADEIVGFGTLVDRWVLIAMSYFMCDAGHFEVTRRHMCRFRLDINVSKPSAKFASHPSNPGPVFQAAPISLTFR